MGAPLSAMFDLGSVVAEEDGVVGDADDAVEALDLGDGGFHGLAGGLVEDVEDVSRGCPAGFGLSPAGQFAGHRVHHLDASLGVAGDDSVADGGEGGAELLFGFKELFGAASEDLERTFGRRRRRRGGGCG